MRLSLSKDEVIPLSICILTLGPNINYYLNDILQYVYGGHSISAFNYIVMALFGVRSYFILFRNSRLKWQRLIIAVIFVCLLFAYIIHPSIQEFIISSDFNPLTSVALFLLFYGFPLMIYSSVIDNWDCLLRFLFLFSLFVIPLAALDYFWVMIPYGSDAVNYMSYSYNQLFAGSICAVYGYKNKKVLPFILSVISFLLVFLGGARGTMVCLLALYIILLFYPFNARKIVFAGVITAIVLVGGAAILNKVISLSFSLVDDVGGFSRTLYHLSEGEFFDSEGRDQISTIIYSAINDNPLGYGILGDRYVLKNHGLEGYAHSIILELICDFGVLIGPILFICLCINVIKVFFKKESDGVFFCFLSMLPAGFIMLFLSSSFLSGAFVFWSLLGMLFNSTTKRKITKV